MRRDNVGRHEDEAVARDDLAVPDLGPVDVLGRQAAVWTRVGESQEPRLPEHVCLGRADGGHVQLVSTDDGHGETNRARLAGTDQGTVWRMEEHLVGRSDRLPQANRDAGREVVVVVVADPLGDELGRLAQLAPACPRDEQVEAPLRSRRRADVGLDHNNSVG